MVGCRHTFCTNAAKRGISVISKMLQVPMDSIVCGNAGRTKSQMDACLTDQERRVYTYYKKMRELNAA